MLMFVSPCMYRVVLYDFCSHPLLWPTCPFQSASKTRFSVPSPIFPSTVISSAGIFKNVPTSPSRFAASSSTQRVSMADSNVTLAKCASRRSSVFLRRVSGGGRGGPHSA